MGSALEDAAGQVKYSPAPSHSPREGALVLLKPLPARHTVHLGLT